MHMPLHRPGGSQVTSKDCQNLPASNTGHHTPSQLRRANRPCKRCAAQRISAGGAILPLQPSAITASAVVRPARQEQSSATSNEPQAWRVTPRMLSDVVTMFNTMPYEHDYWVDKTWVTGQIPHELRGTYLRNGPGLQVSSGKHARHFMDGDGCVLSLAFPGGGAPPRFTNRYVRTKGFVEEQAAGRPIHRNAFTRGAADGSALFNPLDLNFKNVANTSVLYWAGRMWALWEVGLPYELCPRTLETLGESTLDGQIKQRLAGHYRVTKEQDGSQRLVLFGAQVSFTGMHLEFYELDEGGKALHTTQHQLQGMDIMFIHDMMVTEHWYIVIMGPVQFDGKGFLTDYLMGQRSLAELLIYNKKNPSKVFLYPRPGKTRPPAAGAHRSHVLLAPPFFSFHHVNAYERQGGSEVVMDTISWQDIAFDVTQYTVTPSYYQGGCRSQLYRLVADLPSSRISSCEQLVQRTLEFPSVAGTRITGKPYRYAYFSADAVNHETHWAPAQAVLKVTLPCQEDAEKQQAAPAAQQDTPVWKQQQQQEQRHQQQQPAGQLLNHVVAWQPRTGTTPSSSRSSQTGIGARTSGSSNGGSSGGSSSQGRGDAAGVVCEEWRPGQRCFPQEPMFVPRPGGTAEDDGWILVGVHNAETMRGEVAILDAQRISDGPLAIIHLPHPLPCGLHGAWTSDYMGPDPEDVAAPAWRAPGKIREL